MEIDVDQLKQQISIRDLVERYTSKPIRNNKLCCPFSDHQDDTPSFQIYEETNSFFCHGCNRGGSVLDFIMYAEGIDFINAIKHLTGENKIKFSNNFNNLQTDDLLDIIDNLKDIQKPNFDNSLVDEYFGNNHKYFLEQGFKQKTLDFFKIGYCYDMGELHNRCIIPWWDAEGNLTAIEGRDVSGKSSAKYKSKYSSNKQQHLYNLNNAKKHREKGVIVVEDAKSVWRLHQWGFPNAVATGNSDIGSRKWLLMQYFDLAYPCMDNDNKWGKNQSKIIKELKPLMRLEPFKLNDGYKDIAEIREKEIFLKFYNNRKKV